MKLNTNLLFFLIKNIFTSLELLLFQFSIFNDKIIGNKREELHILLPIIIYVFKSLYILELDISAILFTKTLYL